MIVLTFFSKLAISASKPPPSDLSKIPTNYSKSPIIQFCAHFSPQKKFSMSMYKPGPMATFWRFVIDGNSSTIDRGFSAIDNRVSSTFYNRESARFDGRSTRLLISCIRISTSQLTWSDRK